MNKSKKRNIAILGTRGIPNNYGGFEQFAEYLSLGLVKAGFEVTVYNPHFHPYKQKKYEEVNIVRIYSPESYFGGLANFIYDFLCLFHAYLKKPDVIYELGYGSSAISFVVLRIFKPKKTLLVTNMDGLEWRRQKWNSLIKWFTKQSEKIALRYSDFIISDNEGIQNYYRTEFNIDSFFLAYGATVPSRFEKTVLQKYNLLPKEYFLLIARLEPENNIEIIIKAYIQSERKEPLVVVGNFKLKYGKYLTDKYKSYVKVVFLGGIYHEETINSLRHFSKGYLHGHSVGGTNPSLLEAMSCSCLIIAHDNEFNRSVLMEGAIFFSDEEQLCTILRNMDVLADNEHMKQLNIESIMVRYSWQKIIHDYSVFFENCISNGQTNFR